jgi:hypothetical protein
MTGEAGEHEADTRPQEVEVELVARLVAQLAIKALA